MFLAAISNQYYCNLKGDPSSTLHLRGRNFYNKVDCHLYEYPNFSILYHASLLEKQSLYETLTTISKVENRIVKELRGH